MKKERHLKYKLQTHVTCGSDRGADHDEYW